jgi:hypothetical protein
MNFAASIRASLHLERHPHIHLRYGSALRQPHLSNPFGMVPQEAYPIAQKFSEMPNILHCAEAQMVGDRPNSVQRIRTRQAPHHDSRKSGAWCLFKLILTALFELSTNDWFSSPSGYEKGATLASAAAKAIEPMNAANLRGLGRRLHAVLCRVCLTRTIVTAA